MRSYKEEIKLPNFDEKNNELLLHVRELTHGMDSDDVIRIFVPLCYTILVERGALPETIDPRRRRFSSYHYSSELNSQYTIRSIREFLYHCTNNELKDVVSYILSDAYLRLSKHNFINETCSNDDISKLVYQLLDFKDGDSFYDLGSGLGNMIASVYKQAEEDGINLGPLHGCEINPDFAELGEMIVAILSDGKAKYSIRLGDAFDSRGYYADIKKENINKGYVYPPVALRSNLRNRYYESNLFPGPFYVGYSFDESWFFIDNLLSSLDKKDFRAVALVSTRTLTNMTRNRYAQTLASRGYIEGIIELPTGQLYNSQIPSYLLVFSRGNAEVKTIYAGDCLIQEEGRRFHRPSTRLDINKIIDLYNSASGSKCGVVDCKELTRITNWIPSSMPFAITNHQNDTYTPLSEVSKIGVGCGYTSSSFKPSEEATGYKILTSSDINEDGLIKWDSLVNIQMDKTLYDKFIVHKGDVLITTKSTKVKVAVVDKEPEEKVILTGGMIRVVPDPSKLNPTYLKMYLDSDEGIELLKSCSSGSVMIHLSLATFKEIKIPLIDLEKQDKKATEYNEKLARINTYQQRIKEINDEISELINSKEDDE